MADVPCYPYVAAVVGSTLAASKVHLNLFNGTAGGLVVRVWRIDAVPHETAAIAGTLATLYALRTAALGTGTAATVRKFDSRTTLAPNLPSAVGLLSAVTVTPTANSELAGGAINNEETVAGGPKPLFQADPAGGVPPIVLRGGEGLCVQQSALAGAGSLSLFVHFTASKR